MNLVTHLGCLAQFYCGREEHCKQALPMCGNACTRMDHTGFAPAHRGVCFPGLLRACLGPAFCVLPRSKQLKVLGNLVHKGTGSVGHRSVPVRGPSSSGSQELGGTNIGGAVRLTTSRSQRSVSPVCRGSAVSAVYLLWGADLRLQPPGRCQPSRIPGRHG